MEILVETRNLKTHFPILKGILQRPVGAVRAVDDVSMTIAPGQWMGLVGESGCGKTTLGKTVLRFLRPTSGHIYFDASDEIKEEMNSLEESATNPGRLKTLRHDYDLATFSGNRLKALRRNMQLVHQDPYPCRSHRTAHEPLPPRVQWWAETAHRHRPRPVDKPAVHYL